MQTSSRSGIRIEGSKDFRGVTRAEDVLRRSGSEEWEVMPHADSACYSNQFSSEDDEEASCDEIETDVQLTFHILQDGQIAVSLALVKLDTPSLDQPTAPTSTSVRSLRGDTDAATDTPESSVRALSGSSFRGGPTSSSQLSFEHLSEHFSPPSTVADDEESASAPASLPDLDDDVHVEQEQPYGFELGVVSRLDHSARSSDAEVKLTSVASSFADVACMAAANISAAADLSPSLVDRAIAQLQAGDYPLQHEGASTDDISTHQEDATPSSVSLPGSLSSDEDRQSVAASKRSPSQAGSEHPESKIELLQGKLAEFTPKDSWLVTAPSNSLAAIWRLLQDCGLCSEIVAGRCLDALPPRVAARIRCANTCLRDAVTRHSRDINWLGAAVGLSMTGLAVISLLLARSYRTNWQLRAAMARKDDDILKLVGQVVTMQRNVFRPQRVQMLSISQEQLYGNKVPTYW